MKIRVESFTLQLANGQGWNLIADSSAESFLGEFSGILGLSFSENRDLPRLIFSALDKDVRTFDRVSERIKEELGIQLEISGWKSFRFELARLWIHQSGKDLVFEVYPIDRTGVNVVKMWQVVFALYYHLVKSGGIPLHSALIEKEGQACVLAGPGKSGKSTCCQRVQPPWNGICDDDVLILPTGQGRYVAHPFPTWSEHLSGGSRPTWKVEQGFSLKSIFFLKKSKYDRFLPVGKGEAALRIFDSVSESMIWGWEHRKEKEFKEFKEKLFQNALQVAGDIPAFHLYHSLKGRFWEKMDEALSVKT